MEYNMENTLVQESPEAEKLVLNGLFDVKSMEAGTSKYLYINTYPEEGVNIVAVESDDVNVARVSYGNNSESMDSISEDSSNYNFVKLDAVAAGETSVKVTVQDTKKNLGSATKTFRVQVIAPKYEGTERVLTDISKGWKFCLERDMEEVPEAGTVPVFNDNWDDVTIPHCWNAEDGANGNNDYHRGIGWYIRKFTAEELSEEVYGGRQLYLELGAACKVSEIYANGEHLAHHEGGYSRIRVDVTDSVKLGEDNIIAISVDNRINDLTPLSGDFTVFGGLYRDISFIAAGKVHMNLDADTSFGGRGLYVSQRGMQGINKETTIEDVYGNGGELFVTGEVKNSSDETKTVSAEVKIYDDKWILAASHEFEPVNIPAGEIQKFKEKLVVQNPILWDGTKNPYQYNIVFEVKDSEGTVVDRERDRVGFRFYCVDPEEGFFLNGRSYPLHGVCSHQDRFNRGNAATHQDREQDMAIMEDMGANTIRFAHYQHDPYVYELAAERGITVWAEIPMVNSLKNTWDFYHSTENNLRELIHQAYNIPSILMWGIHNEQWPHNAGLTVLLDRLYKICKEEDAARMVTLATAQEPGDDVEDGKWDTISLSWQSDLSAWNKYFGIYQGQDTRYFGKWLNQVHDYGVQHKTICGRPETLEDPDGISHDIPVYVHGNVGMSEYGADCSPFIHEEQPDYWAGSQSEEFTSQWHEIYYKAMSEAKWLWGSYIWNMFEFGSDGRDTTPGRHGINTKGIVTYDRAIKKDAYYYYRANWSDAPTLQITSKRFKERTQDNIKAKVYSNLESVELFVDNVSQGKLMKNGNNEPALNNDGNPDDTLIPNTHMGKFEWDINIAGEGDHEVTAVGTDANGNVYIDTVIWTRKFTDVAGSTSDAYYINENNQIVSGTAGETTVVSDEKNADIPVSQNMPVHAKTAENSGYFPAGVTIDMTDPRSTEEYYYLTGVKIKFSQEPDDCCYGYNIYANNIVGIPTGFVVDAADNVTPGWVEHWTEDGTNAIKNLTLNIQKCSSKTDHTVEAIQELQVYAWRIKGCKYMLDEANKTIDIGTESITAGELRSGLEIMGNCAVKFVDAEGVELDKNDMFGGDCKMVVTDVRKHVFEYKVK